MLNLLENNKIETWLISSKLEMSFILPAYVLVASVIIFLWPQSWLGWPLGIICTLLIAELWYVWLSQGRKEGKLTLLRTGTLMWQQHWYTYQPLFSCRYFLLLFLRSKQQYLFLPIWSDSCPSGDYHRLHTLIRYSSHTND